MSTQQQRKVKSLVIALISSLTVAIGALVEAPPLLLVLASLFTAAIVTARIVKARRQGEARKADEVRAREAAEQPQDPATSLGSSLLLSKLQVESMRASALEAELAEMRKRHDQLLEERMEYLRRAESPGQSRQMPQPVPSPVIKQATGAADPLHRRKLTDALLASEAASKTLKEDLLNLNRTIESISEAIPRGRARLGDVTNNIRRASDAVAKASAEVKAAATRVNQIEGSGNEALHREVTSLPLGDVAGRLASIARQVNDATDVMRLTSLNLKLVAGRSPAPPGTVDAPMAAGNSLEKLMEDLGSTAAAANQLAADFTSLVETFDESMRAAQGESAAALQTRKVTTELIRRVELQLADASDQMRIAVEAMGQKEKEIIEREMSGQVVMSEAAARFAAATGWADSTALGIKTLLQDAESTDEPR